LRTNSIISSESSGKNGYVNLALPDGVVIQAEVHKGYQKISDLNKIPDFLFHKPNSMVSNFAVVEY